MDPQAGSAAPPAMSAQRFNDDYSDAELEELAAPIAQVADIQSRRT
jgi:hypothetical protein